jgi:hypothetical protein
MTLPIKVRSALACDDIRTERGGEIIAIGITNPVIGLTLREPPKPGAKGFLRVHFLLAIDVQEAGEQTISLRVRTAAGKVGTEVTLKVDFFQPEKNIPFPVGPFSVPIWERETGFKLEQLIERRWRLVASWRFEAPAPGAG